MHDEPHGNSVSGEHNQAVNIILSDRFGKWLLAIFVVMVLLLAAIGSAAYRAELKAEQATKTADYSANEFRMTQLWLQRSAVACERGEKMPMVPASLLVK